MARMVVWKRKVGFTCLWRKRFAEYDDMDGIAWPCKAHRWRDCKNSVSIGERGSEADGSGKKWEPQEKPFCRREWNHAVVSRERSSEARCEVIRADVDIG
jgi:hypothetical protein